MPMPKFIKRMSSKKSLKKDASEQDREEHPLPSLPNGHSPHAPLQLHSPTSTLSDLAHDKAVIAHVSKTSSPPQLSVVVSGPLPKQPAPDDDVSRNLAAAWQRADTAPTVSKFDKVLQVVENGIAGAQTTQAQSTMLVTGVKVALEVTGGMEGIERGVKAFAETATVLVKALDEVAKLHPFVGVAVMAFKAVWALEMKRRENDNRIRALFLEMKEMIAVLVQLRNIKDADELAPDGTTIKGRMQELSKSTAENIKACGNATDTYLKKKLIVKVLKGFIWEERLRAFVEVFAKRRKEFEFALSIHTAVGIDTANRKLGSVEDTMKEVNERLRLMTNFFQQSMSPEHQALMKLVDKKGGAKAFLQNEAALKELYDPSDEKRSTKGGELQELKYELQTDPEAAIKENLDTFTRKFDVQTRQITEEVSRLMRREGDRIIDAVTRGPHDKIIDPDVHTLWKDMGWRGSVKIRHFVMALRDYFHDKWERSKAVQLQNMDNPLSALPTGPMDQSDQWALYYINVTRIQPISEAFDDDASGFVSVAEVNTLTTARPLEWSLPGWVAYWAIGWHQSMTIYARKIQQLMAKLFAITPNLPQLVKPCAEGYLDKVYSTIASLSDALDPCEVDESLQDRFELHTKAVEAKLRANLEAVRFDIDDSVTLELVTGSGSIEKLVLPLLYLILAHHVEVFRLAQHHPVHQDEFYDMESTIEIIFDAVDARVNILRSVFQQQKLNTAWHFDVFAHGLLKHRHNFEAYWNPERILTAEVQPYHYDDALEEQGLEMSKILLYPLEIDLIDLGGYDPAPVITFSSAHKLRNLFGRWNGCWYSGQSPLPMLGMIALDLKPLEGSSDDTLSFTGAGQAHVISGECKPGTEQDTYNIVLTLRFQDLIFHCTGTWLPSKDKIIGTWQWAHEDADERETSFLFTRMEQTHLIHYPAPCVLQLNKPRALWKFAVDAITEKRRREIWIWDYIIGRLRNRRRYIELDMRKHFGRPLMANANEAREWATLMKSLTAGDVRLAESVVEKQRRMTTIHLVWCNICDGIIGGARTVCLTCEVKGTFNTMDFCDDQGCLAKTVEHADFPRPHLPTHDLMRFRYMVHDREFGQTYQAAKAGLKRARQFLAQDPSTCGNGNQGEDGQQWTARNQEKDTEKGEEDSDEQEPNHTAAEESGPSCSVCTMPVVQPVWFCVTCNPETFICFDCEPRLATPANSSHNPHTHVLVRCQELVEDVEPTVVEELAVLQSNFLALKEQMQGFESKFDDRLTRLEKMLERLVSASPTPSLAHVSA